MRRPDSQTQRDSIRYRDRQKRVWYVSEVARLTVVSASIDGPNLCLVIRFERDGEERFARWIGGDEWLHRRTLHRLFAAAGPLEAPKPLKERPVPIPHTADDTGPIPHTTDDSFVGSAPPATVALWVKLVALMELDELDDFERRTFKAWDRESLGALRIAVDRRRRKLAE